MKSRGKDLEQAWQQARAYVETLPPHEIPRAIVVYNNFIWPEAKEAQQAAVSKAVQAVLAARELYPDSSLADLYDPLIMPPELYKAHQQLDRVVDRLYGGHFESDAKRVAHLFELYAAATAER